MTLRKIWHKDRNEMNYQLLNQKGRIKVSIENFGLFYSTLKDYGCPLPIPPSAWLQSYLDAGHTFTLCK